LALSLGSAGVANASCASISGISAGSSGGSTCTSTATSFAVGLGNGTDAAASGLFDGSVAIGGSFNRVFTLGDRSTSNAVGGAIIGTPTLTSIGNNTAITVGKGANSYAGTISTTPGRNSPSNQFAFAGPGKNAVNAVNP